MKIKKVDDKPMVIHTKEKAKIHAHEPKGAKIKGSNIYTVERGPKTIGAKVSDDKKKSYRKSTIHQSESKNKGLSRFKRNYRESNTSIKTKNTNLHIAGRTGVLAAGAVTEQVEGGHEVSQAAYLAYEASQPVTGTASKGAALFRKKAAAEAKKRIKKVEAGKKLAKKTAKKAAKDTAKTVAKETAKETAKTTAKVATKTASKTAATAAGTAVAPGVGTAIGIAAGYAAGVSIEVKDEKMTNRSRKIKFFLDSGSCVFSVLHHLKPHVHSHQSWFPSHSLLLFPWFQDDWLLHYPRYQRISYRPDSSYPCQPSALSHDNTSSGLLRSKMAVLPYRIKSRITHASREHLPFAHHSCSYS